MASEILKSMINKANGLMKHYSKDAENELWAMASENDIFMAEHSTDGETVDGFYIEDDYWLYENMNGAL